MTNKADAVTAPPLDADPVLIVDWLELVAFFDPRGVARIDAVENSIKIQDEEHATDDASADAIRDDRRSLIEDEITKRSDGAGDAYPYVLSGDGEELTLKARGARRGACFYLACLVISHFTRSPILIKPPADDARAAVRKKQFQVMATLAVAGHVGGPAVSFGWPRATGETITDAVERCCMMSRTGTARNPPGQEASRSAKDGGMDVIAWRIADDGQPPPAIMYFGQAASGHGWGAKSANDEVDQFLGGYFIERPACQTAGVTVVPFRVSADDHNRYGRRHGHILDRLRTPRAALKGLRLSCESGVAVDEIESVRSLNGWLLRYRRSLRTA